MICKHSLKDLIEEKTGDSFCMECVRELIIKDEREQFMKCLENHRKKSIFTCEHHCFCWDIEVLLSAMEETNAIQTTK